MFLLVMGQVDQQVHLLANICTCCVGAGRLTHVPVGSGAGGQLLEPAGGWTGGQVYVDVEYGLAHVLVGGGAGRLARVQYMLGVGQLG